MDCLRTSGELIASRRVDDRGKSPFKRAFDSNRRAEVQFCSILRVCWCVVTLTSTAGGYGFAQVNSTTWKICNNRCGYVTPAQAAAYNAGVDSVQAEVSALLHVNATSDADFGGLLYADGLSNQIKCA
jgi:hypothetical protein